MPCFIYNVNIELTEATLTNFLKKFGEAKVVSVQIGDLFNISKSIHVELLQGFVCLFSKGLETINTAMLTRISKDCFWVPNINVDGNLLTLTGLLQNELPGLIFL